MERWKEVYKDYHISNEGNMKSSKRQRVVVLKGSFKRGYLIYGMWVDGKKLHKTAHTLVWDAFGNKDRTTYQVDHIDNIKSNNNINNLQLLTPRQNTIKHYKTTDKLSKYIGVSFHKRIGKFFSRIIIDGKCKWLGYFENEYDAYLAYKKELDNLGNNV